MSQLAESELETWSVRALNLAEHASNVVHTDAGALAAGYPAALVAGTTVYAYMTHVPAAGWGRDWVAHGSVEVRFLSPVFDNDVVECVPVHGAVQAQVDGQVRATLELLESPAELAPRPDGDPVHTTTLTLGDAIGGYGLRAGDDLALYESEALVHPAAWPFIGNDVTIATLVTGPWIHVRSIVHHRAAVPLGAEVLVESWITDTFTTRAGDRAVLDVRVSLDGEPVTAIEHESIIKLATSA